MKKDDCKFNFEWDYSQFGNTELGSALYTQRDWNQTLMSKINQTSANIHKGTLRGGGSHILITRRLLPLLESLEYYNNGILSGRYIVEIDDELSFKFGKSYNINSEDVIYVYNHEAEDNRILVPKYSTFPNGIDEVSFRFPSDENELREYKINYYGSITIINYE